MDDNVQTNYTISDLSPGTTYRVCLKARDGHNHTHSNWTHCEEVHTGSYYYLSVASSYWLS